jgi:capsular polysaccharide biosynthesis protein
MSRFRLWARSGSGDGVGRKGRSAATRRSPALPAPGADPRVDAYRRAAGSVDPLESVGVIVDAATLGDDFPVPTGVFAGAQVTVFLLNAPQPPDGQDPARTAGLDPAWRVVPLPRVQRLHVVLAGLGPFDVLIDHGVRSRRHQRRHLANLPGHVRDGGTYIVDDLETGWPEPLVESTAQTYAGNDDDPEDEDEGESALELAARLSRLVTDPDAVSDASPQETFLASTIESMELGDGLVVVRRRGRVLIKVRHPDLVPILRRRSGDQEWHRVLQRVPRAEIVSEAMGYSNDEVLREERYPKEMTVPSLVVRAYDDVIARPGQVLLKDDLVLPDTFRLWRAPMLHATRLKNTSHHFVLPPKWNPEPELRSLSGQYYYADSEYPQHFGHLMTEVLGRLWAWPEAKRENPQLKLLTSTLLPFQAEIFEAYGIDREDIVKVTHPARVESVIAAMPAFHIGAYVSPDVIAETYERLQRGIPKASSPAGERVFLTRERGLWRECVNADALEEFFVRRGFAVLRPEQFSLPEQAAIFREAKVVAGFLGSQLYGQVFSPDPLEVIGVVGSTYTSNNEYLFATALGHTLHQFWCPEVPDTRTEDSMGRPILEMHNDYEFDFENDLPALTTLVDGL